MENKHTPGPWRVKDVNPEAWTRQVWTNESHGSVMIAIITGGVDKEANARLIAAAPDMLAALRVALRHVPVNAMEYSELTHGDRVFPADVIRAAIANVEG